ncbi:hypothetical protein [Lentibacillus sp. JNUCC-1]|uniref:hypothetical protein n=1 Tax=Lentibacillus sp. JNUCC-1 TaxID=2654513 RepID=UPI001E373699|nr:hypothetical protein [Lentibacillus sp. JNUCC-1]
MIEVVLAWIERNPRWIEKVLAWIEDILPLIDPARILISHKNIGGRSSLIITGLIYGLTTTVKQLLLCYDKGKTRR